MISLSPCFSCDAGSGSSPDKKEGLIRLAEDISVLVDTADAPPPLSLKSRILSRISSEPARVETDREGLIVAINPAFTALCGYEFSELQGRKPGRVLQGPGSDPAAIAALRHAVSHGESCQTRLINYHKDGSPYRVQIDLQPIRDRQGLLAGFRATEIKLPLD